MATGYDFLNQEQPARAVLAFASQGDRQALQEISQHPPVGDTSIANLALLALQKTIPRGEHPSWNTFMPKPHNTGICSDIAYKPINLKVSRRTSLRSSVDRSGEEMHPWQEIAYSMYEGA